MLLRVFAPCPSGNQTAEKRNTLGVYVYNSLKFKTLEKHQQALSGKFSAWKTAERLQIQR